MSLANFITANIEKILAEWEVFARTLMPSAAAMDSLALRDHARQILEAIAKDIVTPQTARESSEKSKGAEEDESESIDSAASVHGTLRHTSGFDLRQLFAEYRALRASVLRLWANGAGDTSPDALYQMTRFNEAIDQALAESVARFSDEVAKSRDTFTAVLGHDLRSPLQAVRASANALSDPGITAAARTVAISRIRASVLSMSRMTGDLLEYTRTRLGKTIPINAQQTDVERIVRNSVGEVEAGNPQRSFRVTTARNIVAIVDAARLQQAITNLLSNAVEHGHQGSTIELIVRREAESIAIEVANEGAAISPEQLQVIFDPVLRADKPSPGADASGSLGLGLFIAREIAIGHGGTIEVHSSGKRTSFTILIPTTAKASARVPGAASHAATSPG